MSRIGDIFTNLPTTITAGLSDDTGRLLRAFIENLLEVEEIDDKDLLRSDRVAKLEGVRIDKALNQLGIISDDLFCSNWSKVTGFEVARPDLYPSAPLLTEALKPAFLRYAEAVPLYADEGRIDLALRDPLDGFTPAAIAARTRLKVRVLIGRPQDIQRALDVLYAVDVVPVASEQEASQGSLSSDLDRLRDLASDAPVIKLVQNLLERCVEVRASDVHITVDRRGPRVRFRADGLLQDMGDVLPLHLYDGVVSRIKVLGGLDIAERRLPQDGSTRIVVRGKEVDLRVATMPHLAGEGVVVRILDRSSLTLDFATLGVSPAFVAEFERALTQPNGIVLMTGPTGSGKTTTLYAALKTLTRSDRNVITIEDPIEYQLDGVTQIQVEQKIGFTFASALRAALRQDPDVILIGEIRDAETAQIAARAAMTGHLVLATVHTSSAAAAIPRLIDMNVEPYLLASTVRAIVAQRLVRTVCPSCASPAELDAVRIKVLGLSMPGTPSTPLIGTGCAHCSTTGYKGRKAVTEFLPISANLRDMIARGIDATQLESAARQEGMQTLVENGLEMVLSGNTTLDEIDRVMGQGT